MSQVGQVVGILRTLNEQYQISIPKKLKLIDAYLVYVLLTGIIQFAYCLLVEHFHSIHFSRVLFPLLVVLFSLVIKFDFLFSKKFSFDFLF